MDLFTQQNANERFPIEQGIPVGRDSSVAQRKKWDKPNFPFSKMEVGDSFIVRPEDCGGPPLIVLQNLVSGAASSYCKKNFMPGVRKYTTRQIGGVYVRVWRIL